MADTGPSLRQFVHAGSSWARIGIANSRLPTVLFTHVATDINQVLGKTTSWRELLPGDADLPTKLKSLNAKADGGPRYGCVKASIKFDLGTPSGKLGYTHVAHENLKEWSFAYLVAEGGAEMEYPKSANNGFKAPIRHLKDIEEVVDITLCVIGMNPATATVGWKASQSRESTPAWVWVGAANALAELFSPRQDFRPSTPGRRSNPGPGSWLSSLAVEPDSGGILTMTKPTSEYDLDAAIVEFQYRHCLSWFGPRLLRRHGILQKIGGSLPSAGPGNRSQRTL